MDLWDEMRIVRIDKSGRHGATDKMIKEDPFTLFINKAYVHTFACTPCNLEELAIGFAYAEGLFHAKEDIEDLRIDTVTQEIFLTLKPPRRAPRDNRGVEAFLSDEAIFDMWDNFNERSELFYITGAAHAVALIDGKEILILREDVARHNALAKVIGAMICGEVGPEGKALIFSGRLALEMFKMIERTGVKILLSHGTTTSRAVRRAEEAGITLAGFVKRDYMNVYTHAERILHAGDPGEGA
ncbi:MAG: formate dehydrogenase accessory sulfurtransferase FdhD [Spirochaetaceae bacterium]|jgi:FdhD protein|nr:formate dehydrogenase accessory sulfurtransferase FdhD [Spirochaetaceae bacterium]